MKACAFAIAFAAAAIVTWAGPASAAPVYFDPQAPKFSCADSSTNAIATPGTPVDIRAKGVDTTSADKTILLSPVPLPPGHAANGTGAMCLLSSWTASRDLKAQGLGYYYPLGRSADGSDWERAPGKAGRLLSYLCGEAAAAGDAFVAGEYLCEVTLPMTSSVSPTGDFVAVDAPYYLTYYERTLTARNELSRFLQKTTFGPTSDELDALEAALAAIEQSEGLTRAEAMAQLQTEWVAAQMDPTNFSTGKFTSLREYYRKRLNPKTAETYRIGESGPEPCARHSRWRKYAFTYNDLQNSQYLRWGNVELGGSFQSMTPHKVEIETVEYLTEVPTGAPTSTRYPTGMPSISGMPSVSLMPTSDYFRSSNGTLLGDFTLSPTAAPVSTHSHRRRRRRRTLHD